LQFREDKQKYPRLSTHQASIPPTNKKFDENPTTFLRILPTHVHRRRYRLRTSPVIGSYSVYAESGSSSAGQGTSSSTSLWSCSFEQSSDPLCGMTQEQSRDQFDWTVHRGSTPSRPTGPDFAHHGDFYAFIEASDPRRPNDEAW